MAERVRDVLLPSSIPCGEQTVWSDVSTLLESACTDLRDGELIHGENFSLFAAMSALEPAVSRLVAQLRSRKWGPEDIFVCDESGKLVA